MTVSTIDQVVKAYIENGIENANFGNLRVINDLYTGNLFYSNGLPYVNTGLVASYAHAISGAQVFTGDGEFTVHFSTVDNVVTGNDILYDDNTGNISLRYGRTYRLMGAINPYQNQDVGTNPDTQQQLKWIWSANGATIGSSVSVGQYTSWTSSGAIVNAIFRPADNANIRLCFSANNSTSTFSTNQNWFDIQVVSGYSPFYPYGNTDVSNYLNDSLTTPNVSANSTQIATTAFVQSVIPRGGIIMWSGSSTAIPEGWHLCDGTNSTPDLRGQLVVGAGGDYAVGATGGSANAVVVSHTHTASTNITDSGHSHYISGASKDDGNFSGANSNSQDWGLYADAGSYTSNDPNHIYGRNSASATTGITANTSVNSTGSSGTNDNLPPYYALCYIMKVV